MRALPVGSVQGDMVVLDGREPFDMLRTLHGVDDALLVGENVVIQRGTDCLLCDPVDGSQVRLTSGSLAAALGTEGFLFCRLRAGGIEYGQGSLHKYSLAQRSEELIWDTGPTECCEYQQIFPSPESLFLFIPLRRSDPPVYSRIYVLFGLDSHEAVGQLFSPFEGKDHIHFLGWADGEDVEAPENAKLE